MVGNAYIFMIHHPEEAETERSTRMQAITLTIAYTTNGITNATSYAWTLTPSEAGTITGTTTTATVDWDDAFYGTANISVTGVNSCFNGPASDNLNVSVAAAPQPAISGDQSVCDGRHGIIYTTAANEGNTYNWEVSAGEITGGAGTNEISVNWGNPGNGYVKVTENNGTCSATTTNFDIFIEDCVGIGEDDAASFSLYPNPVKNELVIRFAGQAANSVMIVE